MASPYHSNILKHAQTISDTLDELNQRDFWLQLNFVRQDNLIDQINYAVDQIEATKRNIDVLPEDVQEEIWDEIGSDYDNIRRLLNGLIYEIEAMMRIRSLLIRTGVASRISTLLQGVRVLVFVLECVPPTRNFAIELDKAISEVQDALDNKPDAPPLLNAVNPEDYD